MLMDLFNTKNSESLLDNRAEKNESSSEVVLTKKTDLASVLTKKAEQQRQKVYSNEFKEGAADSTELPVKDSSKKMLEQKPFAAESDESGNDYSGGKGSDARYLLRRQQVSRDRCFAIINEWASGVEISDESIREYFDAVSILSQNQAKFLLPFAEKRLSLEQKKLFMEKAKEVKKTVLNETKSFYRKEDSSCPWIASDIFTKMDEAFFSSINRAFFQEKEIARKQLLKKAARELLK